MVRKHARRNWQSEGEIPDVRRRPKLQMRDSLRKYRKRWTYRRGWGVRCRGVLSRGWQVITLTTYLPCVGAPRAMLDRANAADWTTLLVSDWSRVNTGHLDNYMLGRFKCITVPKLCFFIAGKTLPRYVHNYNNISVSL